MRNLYRELQELLPQPKLQVGILESISQEIATIRLPSGETLSARGPKPEYLGQRVFVRNNVIEGLAPNLPTQIIEI